MSKHFLLSTILSTLLLTTTLSADGLSNCSNGHCKIDLSGLKKLAPTHNEVVAVVSSFQPIEEDVVEYQSEITTDRTVEYLGETLYAEVDESEIIYNEIYENEIISGEVYENETFANTQYPSTDDMGETYITLNLPSSEDYCEENKEALYNPELHTYICA